MGSIWWILGFWGFLFRRVIFVFLVKVFFNFELGEVDFVCDLGEFVDVGDENDSSRCCDWSHREEWGT